MFDITSVTADATDTVIRLGWTWRCKVAYLLL
jgi:hypothetical protein